MTVAAFSHLVGCKDKALVDGHALIIYRRFHAYLFMNSQDILLTDSDTHTHAQTRGKTPCLAVTFCQWTITKSDWAHSLKEKVMFCLKQSLTHHF